MGFKVWGLGFSLGQTCVFLGFGEDDDLRALLVHYLLHDALQLARLVVVLTHLHHVCVFVCVCLCVCVCVCACARV